MEAPAAFDALRALAALLLLLALPGLTVVRAPWTAVPGLSLAFWLVSWTWLDFLHAMRTRFVLGALLFFALLAALRLPRLPRARPGEPTWLVALVALAALLPCARLGLPVGDAGPLRALSVRLLVWRDGLPRTYEPLLPLHVFGADRHAVDWLAADVALLGGVSPAQATLLASLAAAGLLLVALDALLVALGASRTAAASVVFAAATTLALAPANPLPGAQLPQTLGAALIVSGLAVLWRGRGRASAVAAGLLFGAACVAEPWLAACATPLASAATLLRLASASAAQRAHETRRLAWAVSAVLLLAAPAWLRFDAPWVPWSRLVFTRAHGVLVLLVTVSVLVARYAPPVPSRRLMRLTAASALVAQVAFASRLAPRLPPTGDELRALFAVLPRVSVREALCGSAASSDVWIPALLGRALEPGEFPAAHPAPAGRARACRARPQVVANP